MNFASNAQLAPLRSLDADEAVKYTFHDAANIEPDDVQYSKKKEKSKSESCGATSIGAKFADGIKRQGKMYRGLNPFSVYSRDIEHASNIGKLFGVSLESDELPCATGGGSFDRQRVRAARADGGGGCVQKSDRREIGPRPRGPHGHAMLRAVRRAMECLLDQRGMICPQNFDAPLVRLIHSKSSLPRTHARRFGIVLRLVSSSNHHAAKASSAQNDRERIRKNYSTTLAF